MGLFLIEWQADEFPKYQNIIKAPRCLQWVNPFKYDLSCVTFIHYERHRINPNRVDAGTPMEGCGVSI
jgi:hypothetical protein